MLETLLSPFKWVVYRATCDAAQAGMYAALHTGSTQPELSIEQAAAAYRALFAAPPADETAPTEAPSSHPPLPASPPAALEPRRGPGRPRKFQEPPQ